MTALATEYQATKVALAKHLTRMPNRGYTYDGKPTAWTKRVRLLEATLQKQEAQAARLVLRGK